MLEMGHFIRDKVIRVQTSGDTTTNQRTMHSAQGCTRKHAQLYETMIQLTKALSKASKWCAAGLLQRVRVATNREVRS